MTNAYECKVTIDIYIFEEYSPKTADGMKKQRIWKYLIARELLIFNNVNYLIFYCCERCIHKPNFSVISKCNLTLPVFPIIWNSERCSRTIDRKYGKIAKRSTRFIGSMKNLIFLGEQVNLTTYSMVKYTAVNASTQTMAAITCSLPLFSLSGWKIENAMIKNLTLNIYLNNVILIL